MTLDEIIQFYSYERSIETLAEEIHSQLTLQSYPDVDSRIMLCYVVGACADDLRAYDNYDEVPNL